VQGERRFSRFQVQTPKMASLEGTSVKSSSCIVNRVYDRRSELHERATYEAAIVCLRMNMGTVTMEHHYPVSASRFSR
jgi:hypothetical protein